MAIVQKQQLEVGFWLQLHYDMLCTQHSKPAARATTGQLHGGVMTKDAVFIPEYYNGMIMACDDHGISPLFVACVHEHCR